MINLTKAKYNTAPTHKNQGEFNMNNLTKITEVSNKYDVTTRTLRYYEDIGLLTSTRNDNVSYRLYDETALNRLEQILILRKLNINIKDIQRIFNAAGSEVVLEVLNKKIKNIDDEVALLHELKNIVLDFIHEIERVNFHNHSDIKQLYDKAKEIETQFANVDYIGKPNRTNEQAMNQVTNSANLDRLIEITDKLDKKIPDIMVVRIPGFRALTSAGHDKWGSLMDWAWSEGRFERLFKNIFFDCTDFLIRKNGKAEYIMAIQDHVSEADAGPFKIIDFKGGLYAMAVSIDGDMESIGKVHEKINKWLANTNFEHDQTRGIMGQMGFLDKEIKQGLGYNQLQRYVPIRISEEKLKKIDEEQRQATLKIAKEQEKIKPFLIEKMNKIISSNPVNIDLTTLEQSGDMNVWYKDGLLNMKTDEARKKNYVATPQKFTAPLKIILRAKTDSNDIRIRYGKGRLIFNIHNSTDLSLIDISNGKGSVVKSDGTIPINEFVDIEWIITKEFMAVNVNNKLRHIASDYAYINEFNNNANYQPSNQILLCAAYDSTVTVETLQITEI